MDICFLAFICGIAGSCRSCCGSSSCSTSCGASRSLCCTVDEKKNIFFIFNIIIKKVKINKLFFIFNILYNYKKKVKKKLIGKEVISAFEINLQLLVLSKLLSNIINKYHHYYIQHHSTLSKNHIPTNHI